MGPVRQSRSDGVQYDLPPNLPRNVTDTQSLVDNLNSKFKETHANFIKAFHKYKSHYDRKAQALPLKVIDFVFLLNPKINSQSQKLYPLTHSNGKVPTK